MGADHTKDIVANIIAEAKFGSGSTGGVAAYEKHAFAIHEGTPMQAPPDSIDMHMATVNRAYRKLLGRKMGAVSVFDNGILTPGRTFNQYLQDDRWIDSLINGYNAGVIPLDTFSHAIHLQNFLKKFSFITQSRHFVLASQLSFAPQPFCKYSFFQRMNKRHSQCNVFIPLGLIVTVDVF